MKSEVSDALAGGARVVLHHEGGKAIPITSVQGGQLRDDKGQPWGMLGALSHKDSRIEISHPAEAPAAPERPLELGERYTIGHAAERQIAGMMPIVGANFQPGKPTKLWRPDMSGKYVGRARREADRTQPARCACARSR